MELRKKIKGFTVLEVLVVFGIIVLMSGTFLFNFKGSDRISKLNSEVRKFSTNLRIAQNNSMGGVDSGVDFINWGVHFEKNESYYLIFKDEDGNYSYSSSQDSVYKRIELPSEMSISYNYDEANMDVVFKPPHGNVYINKTQGSLIDVSFNYNSLTKEVSINNLGLIEVK